MLGNTRGGGNAPHQEEWGHVFWSWVADLKDDDAPTLLNRGGDIANTGVAFNFNYKPGENELTLNLQVGDPADFDEGTTCECDVSAHGWRGGEYYCLACGGE